MLEVDCRSWELDPEKHSFFRNYFEVCVDFDVNSDIRDSGLIDNDVDVDMEPVSADLVDLAKVANTMGR